jgi:transcriptional regulator with XRE-family HTH domain
MLPDQESRDGSIPIAPTRHGQSYPPNWPKFEPPDISLKGRRAALKLTQEELADKLGVAVATLDDWESGRSKPDAEGMLDLALQHLERVAYRACRSRYEGFQYIGPDDEARRLTARLAEKPIETPTKKDQYTSKEVGRLLGHRSKCDEPYYEPFTGW